MWYRTNFSKHFMITDVSAIGLQLPRSSETGFLGTGMLVADFRHEGMMAFDREMLKILMKIPASWSAHAWSTLLGAPSGPAASLRLTDLSICLSSCSCSVGVWVVKAEGGGDTEAGLLILKWAKKLFSCSASEACACTELLLLLYL